MNLLEIAKEIDRILNSKIEILPGSPIHMKLKLSINDSIIKCPSCLTTTGDIYHECADCGNTWITEGEVK